MGREKVIFRWLTIKRGLEKREKMHVIFIWRRRCVGVAWVKSSERNSHAGKRRCRNRSHQSKTTSGHWGGLQINRSQSAHNANVVRMGRSFSLGFLLKTF